MSTSTSDLKSHYRFFQLLLILHKVSPMNFLKPPKYILMSQIRRDDLKEFTYVIGGTQYPIKKKIWLWGKSDFFFFFWSNILSDNWIREIFSALLIWKNYI